MKFQIGTCSFLWLYLIAVCHNFTMFQATFSYEIFLRIQLFNLRIFRFLCPHWQVENYNITDDKTLAHDDIRAVMQFPANYTESIIGRYMSGYTATDANVTGSIVDIWIDTSSKLKCFKKF